MGDTAALARRLKPARCEVAKLKFVQISVTGAVASSNGDITTTLLHSTCLYSVPTATLWRAHSVPVARFFWLAPRARRTVAVQSSFIGSAIIQQVHSAHVALVQHVLRIFKINPAPWYARRLDSAPKASLVTARRSLGNLEKV